MAFSEKQLKALARGVPEQAIRTRNSGGKELTFIEGWYAVAQANRIFGFDGWDRETVETKCLQAREARGTFTAIYTAKVRITVRSGDAVVVREGHGTGEGQGGSAGEVQDRALKAAETDATKRALCDLRQGLWPRALCGQPRKAERRKATSTPDAGASAPTATDSPARSRHRSARSRDSAKGSPTLGAAPLTAVRIQKNLLAFPEPERVRDKEHLRYVAAQPCLLCSATPSDPHHVRFAQPRAMARKVGDDFTVPLCRKHHRDLHHSGNESAWWHDMGIEPLEIARDLWEESQRDRKVLGELDFDEAKSRIKTVPDTPQQAT